MQLIKQFYATHKAKQHMKQEHNVNWDEVEDVLFQNPPLRRTKPSPNGERRYYVSGRTVAGRMLRVILAKEQGNIMRVITAYEPSDNKQRRRFKH